MLGISTGTSNYSFTYDEFGNRTATKVGGYTLATYSYGANNGPMLSMKYGSASGSLDTISYTYDKYGNTSEKRVNGTLVYEGIADNTGAVAKAVDYENNLQYNYVYDSTDRLVSSTRVNTADNSRLAMFEYDFDLNNNLTKLAVLTPNGSNVTNYIYGKDNLPETVTFGNGKKLTYTYDTLGRNNKITIDIATPITTDYTYCAYSDGTDTYRSNLLNTEKIGDIKYKYIYDVRNNITEIQEVTGSGENEVYTPVEKYTYDALDQITQVDYLTQNKRVAYIYDLGGNISKEKIYTLADDGTATLSETNSYTYGDVNWSDKLTKYKGQSITYDEIGNPLTYRDGFTFTWSNGRQLDSLTKNGKTVSYTYDTNGMRLTKTVDGVENTYLYEDGLLVQETRGDMILDYSYDANGRLTMGAYRANESATPGYFYYALNSRGDVIGLYNSSGTIIGKYTYDTWGNVTSITNAGGVDVSNQNNMLTRQPFRYRSYYYDTDSGFYYLHSRYYDPVTHRFINADGLVSTGTGALGYNMFAYCENNPVNCSDISGSYPTRDREMQIQIANGDSNYSIMDVTRFQMFNNRYGSTYTNNTQSTGLTVAYGTVKDFNYKGWKYRIDSGDASENSKKHIHVYNKNKSYSQNFDGTTSHGCKDSPPNSVKKKLKEEGIWDWDGNAMKQEPEYLMMYVPEGEMSVSLMNPDIYNVYFLPSGLTVPTIPFSFAPTATFTFVPALIY